MRLVPGDPRAVALTGGGKGDAQLGQAEGSSGPPVEACDHVADPETIGRGGRSGANAHHLENVIVFPECLQRQAECAPFRK